ncbi:MAG: decaprenyl-phosphate phosphoribosyltransferase [Candidatus Riflebacteria bacterium]|nr:decaprenyl-phosphate phosphoribosyltransferase [Candidatus Riflebacteria bacterium]
MEHSLVIAFLRSLRPRQWTKNLVVLAGLVFSTEHLLGNWPAWLAAGGTTLLFCLLSGGVYLMNDLVDADRDRQHPEKSKRPIPSGALPESTARAGLAGLLLGCLLWAWALAPGVFPAALAYFLLNLAYTFWLKRVVLVDVMCIAVSFVLRAQAGVVCLRGVDPGIQMSKWLLICTFLLALFLALAKRRQEIRRFKGDATRMREALADYTPHFIDEMTGIICASTLIAYSIYTVSPETTAKFGTDALVFTIPPVLYGIFRYLYLIHVKELGDNPSEIMLTDRPMQLTLALWVAIVVWAIHLHPGGGAPLPLSP